MSWGAQQQVRNTTPGGGTSITTTLASTQNGSLLVAAIGGTDAAGDLASDVTMPAGWVDCGAGLQSSGHALLRVFYYPNNPGSITSVIGGITGGGDTSGYLHIVEFTGAPSSAVPDQANGISNCGTGATLVSSHANGVGGALCIGCAIAYGLNGAYGSDSGWTTQYTSGIGGWGGPEIIEWFVQATAGTFTFGASASQVGSYGSIIVLSFDPPASSDPFPVGYSIETLESDPEFVIVRI